MTKVSPHKSHQKDPNKSLTKLTSVTKGSIAFSKEVLKGFLSREKQDAYICKAFSDFMDPLFLHPDFRVVNVRELESMLSDRVMTSLASKFDLEIVELGEPINSPKRGHSCPKINESFFYPEHLDFSNQREFIESEYSHHLPHSKKITKGGRYFPKMYIYNLKTNNKGKYLIYYTGGAFLLTHHTYFWHLPEYFPDYNLVFVSYSLGPEFSYPQGILDSIDAYFHIMNRKPTTLSILGESAGGQMCLQLAVYIKEHFKDLDNYMAPKSIILMSPFTDMTLSGQSIEFNGQLDSIKPSYGFQQFLEMYLGFPLDTRTDLLFIKKNDTHFKSMQMLTLDDLKLPMFSPHNYNELLHGLPPINIQTGSKEILLSDNMVLAQKLQKYDVKVTWTIYEDQVHMWQTFSWIESAKRSYMEAREFINKYE